MCLSNISESARSKNAYSYYIVNGSKYFHKIQFTASTKYKEDYIDETNTKLQWSLMNIQTE